MKDLIHQLVDASLEFKSDGSKSIGVHVFHNMISVSYIGLGLDAATRNETVHLDEEGAEAELQKLLTKIKGL